MKLTQYRRRRGRSGRRIALAALFLTAAAAPASAQVADTARIAGDTIEAVPDTVGIRTARDSVVAARVLVPLGREAERSLAHGVWVWNRDELLRSKAFDLADLLEQVPGVTLVRSGYFGYPVAAGAFGSGGGRTEIVWDGFELDPLTGATVDLARVEVAALKTVRVLRDLNGVRIEIESEAPTEGVPYTRVEAGTGEFDTEMFRGVFLAPRAGLGPLGLAGTRLTTDGIGGSEPASTFGLWARYGWISASGRRGLIGEIRRQTIDRPFDRLYGRQGYRADWMLRARSEVVPGLVAEAFVGRSEIGDDAVDTDSTLIDPNPGTPSGEDVDIPLLHQEPSSTQGGLRAALERERFWGRSVLRLRSGEGLPGTEIEVAGGVRLPADVHAQAEARLESWSGEQGNSFRIHAGWASPIGVTPFVEWTSSRTGVPHLLDDDGEQPFTERSGLRAGAGLRWRWFDVVGALMTLDADTSATFGLDFETRPGLYAAEKVTGYEAGGSVRLFWDPLRAEAWYTSWFEGANTIYQPPTIWRGGLVYHHLPLESGNLEIYGRAEVNHRSAMLVPFPLDAENPVQAVPEFTSYDAYLQIRVVDVRAFIRAENLANRFELQDIPGRNLAPARVLYGVKWEFRN